MQAGTDVALPILSSNIFARLICTYFTMNGSSAFDAKHAKGTLSLWQ